MAVNRSRRGGRIVTRVVVERRIPFYLYSFSVPSVPWWRYRLGEVRWHEIYSRSASSRPRKMGNPDSKSQQIPRVCRSVLLDFVLVETGFATMFASEPEIAREVCCVESARLQQPAPARGRRKGNGLHTSMIREKIQMISFTPSSARHQP